MSQAVPCNWPRKLPGCKTICFQENADTALKVFMQDQGHAVHCNINLPFDEYVSDCLWEENMPEINVHAMLKAEQKINYFPFAGLACRKDAIAKACHKLEKSHPELDTSFAPTQWSMPEDKVSLVSYIKKNPNCCYIVKEGGGSNGNNIFITYDIKKYLDQEDIVIQRYVEKPLLVEGHKVDLRLIAMVTCLNPLRVYFFRNAEVRFASMPYRRPSKSFVGEFNPFQHLTNWSLNSENEDSSMNGVSTGSSPEQCKNSIYRSSLSFTKYIEENGYDSEKLWADTWDVCMKGIAVSVPKLRKYQQKYANHLGQNSCYQIFGLDVMYTEEGKPVFLENNHDPEFGLFPPMHYYNMNAMFDSAKRILEREENGEDVREQVWTTLNNETVEWFKMDVTDYVKYYDF